MTAVPELDPAIAAKGYAHPDALVSTAWLAEHLDDPTIRIIESDEDVLLYDTGHIPGALKVDWHADLNDPLVRDYVGARAVPGAAALARHRRIDDRDLLRRQEQLVGRVRASGCSSCSASPTPSCSTADG